MVPPGEQECVRCRRVKATCIIKDDDERRRRRSAKAHADALAERVSLLESMLKERDVASPLGTAGLPGRALGSPVRDLGVQTSHVPSLQYHTPLARANENAHLNPLGRTSPHGKTRIAHQDDSILAQLLQTGDRVRYNQHIGRASYYGPTANSHILSNTATADRERNHVVLQNEEQAHAVIRALPLETHDYLMALFWDHHNDVLFVVHKPAFDQDRHSGSLRYYSAFLHLCALAMGYRFADKQRSDIRAIARNAYESTIHQEAKRILALSLDDLGDIPSIAALLILGDLEVGVGRADVGWMYTGIALRLFVDMGLHIEADRHLSEWDRKPRIGILRACFVADRFWALFLGRPTTSLGSMDNLHSESDSELGVERSTPQPREATRSTRINEALISLMSIAGKLIDDVENHRHENIAQDARHHSSFFRMAKLDRELRQWLNKLASDLQSTGDNLATGPYSLYLLHQQYYALLILLHRPFACYDSPLTACEDGNTLDSHFLKASREICLKSSLAMASLFRQHRQRFNGKRTFRMGMQQAGIAMTALIAAVKFHTNVDRDPIMQCLATLRLALLDMAHAFYPAGQMVSVLDAAIGELQPVSSNHGHGTSLRGRRSQSTLGDNTFGSNTTSSRMDNTIGQSWDSTDFAQGLPQSQHWTAGSPGVTGSLVPAAASGPCDNLFLPTVNATTELRPDEWEFQSIDSMMGVPGLADGDLVDLLQNFDQVHWPGQANAVE